VNRPRNIPPWSSTAWTLLALLAGSACGDGGNTLPHDGGADGGGDRSDAGGPDGSVIALASYCDDGNACTVDSLDGDGCRFDAVAGALSRGYALGCQSPTVLPSGSANQAKDPAGSAIGPTIFLPPSSWSFASEAAMSSTCT
jgi:hypothetical protein